MATAEAFTIIDDGRDVPVTAEVRGDRVRLGPGALAALGWPAGAAEAWAASGHRYYVPLED